MADHSWVLHASNLPLLWKPFIEEEADNILIVLTLSIEHCNLIQASGSCSS